MKRVLGLVHLTAYGVGMIVGAGIYSVIGKAAGAAGETLGMSFLIAGISAFLTALSYAELSSMYPKAGAEYIYLKNIFPNLPILAFLCGSLMIFAGVCTVVTVATAFSGYLSEVFNFSMAATSFLVVLFFCLLSIWGVKEASWLNIGLTLLEIMGLIIFISIGMKSSHYGENISTTIDFGTITGASMIIFAYFGFENIANFAEEVHKPEKNIPRAIILSLAFSTILYLLVSFSALSLASPEDLMKSDGPLSAVLKGTHRQAGSVIGIIAMFSTANTILISILSTSRIGFSMAREHDLPKAFARLSKRGETPWTAVIGILILTCVLLPIGGIRLMASASSFATMMAFILINLALIHLRFVRPDTVRPFRAPINFGRWPMTAVMAVLISFALLFFFEAEVYYLGITFLVLAIATYFFSVRFKKRSS